MKKEKNNEIEQLKDAIKFLKKFMTMSFRQQRELISKLEKKVNK